MPRFGFRGQNQVIESQEQKGARPKLVQNPRKTGNRTSQYTQAPGVKSEDGKQAYCQGQSINDMKSS